jgi:hypothetical protein
MQYDVILKSRKTGEEKILPEPVYDNNLDDLNQEFDFVGRMEIPTDGSEPIRPQPAPTAQSIASNQNQSLFDELLRLREENKALKAQEPKKIGRPTKEKEPA